MSLIELTKESLDRLAKSLVDKPKPVDPAITYGIPKTIKPEGSEVDTESINSKSTQASKRNAKKSNQTIKPKKKKRNHKRSSHKVTTHTRDHSLVSNTGFFDSKVLSSIATTSSSLGSNSTTQRSLGILESSASGTQRLTGV